MERREEDLLPGYVEDGIEDTREGESDARESTKGEEGVIS